MAYGSFNVWYGCTQRIWNLTVRHLKEDWQKHAVMFSPRLFVFLSENYYPHMLIGMLGIYRLLCFSVCPHEILVMDISGVGWRRAIKFCRMVDLGVHQVFSPLVNFCPSVSSQAKTLVTQIDIHVPRSLARCDKLTGEPLYR